ncbi:MAG: hypothetical protein QOF86_1209 [Baekduia sp.]|nr:hypothetical protein [Baekduia sp.]
MVAMAMTPASVPLSSPASAPSRLLPRPAVMGRDVLYLVSGLPAGIVAFTVLVTGIALAAGLAVTLLGIPVFLATLIVARALGDAERWRAGWVLGRRVPRTDRRWTGGVWQRFKAAGADPGAWRDLTWGLILLPFGILGFTVAVTLWSVALGALTSPFWYWSLPRGTDTGMGLLDSTALLPALGRVGVGIALVPPAAWTCRATADATARAARALLQH